MSDSEPRLHLHVSLRQPARRARWGPMLAAFAPLLLLLAVFQNFSYAPVRLQEGGSVLSEDQVLLEAITPQQPGFVPVELSQPRRLFFTTENRLLIRYERDASIDAPRPLQLFIEDRQTGRILPIPLETNHSNSADLSAEQLQSYLSKIQQRFATPAFSADPQDYGLRGILVDSAHIRSVRIERLSR